MRRYSVCIFDLDGTLLNTLDDLATATNAALAHHGLPGRTTDEVRRFVGNGIHNLIRRAVPQGSDASLIDAVEKTFNDYYAAHSLVLTRPYPGIPELLEELTSQGIDLCVVSNKGDYAVGPLVRHFFGDVFQVAVGEREGIRRKPAPDTVLACIDRLRVDPKEVVYVGDSEVDVATANNAAIDNIICTWGFRDRHYLEEQGATRFVDTAQELAAMILADA